MSDFKELIKSFPKTREYVRDFFVYGFKTRDEFKEKIARTYDNERRRIESWISGFIKQDYTADYNQEMISSMENIAAATGNKGSAASADGGDQRDEMTTKAIEVVVDAGQASTSLLQRKLKLGYARAARIMDEMEEMGIIGPYEGSKPRQVLITKNQWLEMMINNSNEQ